MNAKPTRQTYGELQKAYDFYNRRLFKGELPPCLITLQRKARAYGYFSPDRWNDSEDEEQTIDEIALNPQHFADRTDEDVLSTLVHEMVHLWQHHFGEPGRGRYHNKQWALEMDRVGLTPSTTGQPGGARTGDRVSHYIVAAGRFDKATEKLIADGFRISWNDRFFGVAPKKPSARQRLKYTCPGCEANAWAKPDLSFRCNDCKKDFEPEDSETKKTTVTAAKIKKRPAKARG